jgi:hypothetical protein
VLLVAVVMIGLGIAGRVDSQATATPELRLESRNGDKLISLTVDQFRVLETYDGYGPDKDLFVIVEGRLFGARGGCLHGWDFKLLIGDREYDAVTEWMDRFQESLNKIDYPGWGLRGQCYDDNEMERTFLVFDIDTPRAAMALQFFDTQAVLLSYSVSMISTATPTNTPLPTATSTPTLTPSRTPTNTLTPTKTLTPSVTPTASDTLTPSQTWTPTKTFTPTATLPSRSLQDRVDEGTERSKAVGDMWLNIAGVVRVGVSSVIPNADGDGAMVLGEVCVSANSINFETATALFLIAERLVGMPMEDFSVILTDGNISSDFIYIASSRSLRETVITQSVGTTCDSVTPIAGPTRTPVGFTGGSRSPETYTVMSNANVRRCSSTTCGIVRALRGGDLIDVVGSESGASVAGSTTWYEIRFSDGATGFIHSSLVASGVRSVVQATSRPPTGSGGGGGGVGPPAGPTSFICPKNCDGAIAMGLTAQQAATCPGLDRDHDGVACYGD